MFTVVILALVAFILAARSKLVASGRCQYRDQRRKDHYRCRLATSLLQTLSDAGPVSTLRLWWRR